MLQLPESGPQTVGDIFRCSCPVHLGQENHLTESWEEGVDCQQGMTVSNLLLSSPGVAAYWITGRSGPVAIVNLFQS